MIHLYKIGFEAINEVPVVDSENLFKLRDDEIKDMLELQFMLSYKANISKEDSDNMTPFEITNWFNMLKERNRVEEEERNRVEEEAKK